MTTSPSAVPAIHRRLVPRWQTSPDGLICARSHTIDRVVTVELWGELCLASVGWVDRVIREAERVEPRRTIIDLSDLSFIDSRGLNLLVDSHRRAERAGRRLSVRAGGASARLISLCGLDRLFELLPSRQ